MFVASVLLLALASTGLAQAPEGYKTVYLTSMVDEKFVIEPKSATAGAGLVVNTNADTAIQKWYLTEGDSSIQLADTDLCMDAGAQANWRNMAAITIETCDATNPGQQWDVMEDGRIALKASTPQQCIDLQYMRAVANNPVGLYSCAGLGNIGARDAGINWPLVEVTE